MTFCMNVLQVILPNILEIWFLTRWCHHLTRWRHHSQIFAILQIFFQLRKFSEVFFAKLFFKHTHYHHNAITEHYDGIGENDSSEVFFSNLKWLNIYHTHWWRHHKNFGTLILRLWPIKSAQISSLTSSHDAIDAACKLSFPYNI